MAQEKPKKNGKDKAAPKTLSLTISVGKATALGVLVVFVVAWAFVLGVVVGRGYRPEKAVPEIERIMPAQPVQNGTADLGVLKPEELNYMDQLSKTPPIPPKAAQAAKEATEKAVRDAAAKAAKQKKDEAAKAAKEAKAGAAKGTAGKTEAAKPAGATAQKTVPAPAPVATPAPVALPMQAQKSVQQVAKAPEVPTVDAPGQRFAYVYQVAAVDTPAGAQALVAKIKSVGLFASVEPTAVGGKTWHRVLVQFRGTPEETRDMKDRLAKAGFERVIMKSKNPI